MNTRYVVGILDALKACEGVHLDEKLMGIYEDWIMENPYDCLLYTSDAADEEDSVDLGGRRIIKKKKNYDTD